MSNYEYVLLDWDGNLAKTLDVWLEACRIPLQNRGLQLTDEQIAASFGAFKSHIIEWGFESEVEDIVDEADMIAVTKLPYVELYPDALEVLEKLKAMDRKLALITTSPHDNISALLGRYSMRQYFDAIVANEDTTRHKPDPEPLEKALELLGGNKEKAIMIGDSDKDLGAAYNAGIDSILFYPPEHKKFYNLEKLKSLNPTHVVEDFREVLNIV